MRLQWRGLRNPGRRWSPPNFAFTVLLVSLCLSCYASFYLFERTMPQMVVPYLALSREGISNGFYWQFFSCFIPSPSLWQLLAGLVPLYLCGSELESIVGPRLVAGAFVFTILPASATSLLWPVPLGQMGLWPGICGLLAVLAAVLPMLEIRWQLRRWSVSFRLKTLAFISVAFIFVATCVGWLPGNAPITVPVALAAGYFYARLLGYGFPSAPELYFRQRRIQHERRARLSATDFIEQEVDPILEKIGRSGMASLTRSERKVLRESAAKFTSEASRG